MTPVLNVPWLAPPVTVAKTPLPLPVIDDPTAPLLHALLCREFPAAYESPLKRALHLVLLTRPFFVSLFFFSPLSIPLASPDKAIFVEFLGKAVFACRLLAAPFNNSLTFLSFALKTRFSLRLPLFEATLAMLRSFLLRLPERSCREPGQIFDRRPARRASYRTSPALDFRGFAGSFFRAPET